MTCLNTIKLEMQQGGGEATFSGLIIPLKHSTGREWIDRNWLACYLFFVLLGSSSYCPGFTKRKEAETTKVIFLLEAAVTTHTSTDTVGVSNQAHTGRKISKLSPFHLIPTTRLTMEHCPLQHLPPSQFCLANRTPVAHSPCCQRFSFSQTGDGHHNLEI